MSRLEIELSRGRGAPGQARRALRRLDGRLSAGERSTLTLLVSELVTNAVLHADGAGGVVRLRVEVSDDAVHVAVADAGSGFVKRPPVPREGGRGGYGLFLVEQMASRWGVERGGGAEVWFELDRVAA